MPFLYELYYLKNTHASSERNYEDLLPNIWLLRYSEESPVAASELGGRMGSRDEQCLWNK